MRQPFNAVRFLLACAIIFGSGYFVAKPHSNADRQFAPLMCLLAVSYLWRSRNPPNPLLSL
jgi:hypothetical protein